MSEKDNQEPKTPPPEAPPLRDITADHEPPVLRQGVEPSDEAPPAPPLRNITKGLE